MSSPGPDLLATIAKERPRLMATASAIARTRSLVAAKDTARRWFAEVRRQADLLLTLAPLHPDWVHDPRETDAAPLPRVRPPQSSNGPAAPLDIARLFCLRIETLGIMWLLTGQPRYRVRARAELVAMCNFPDWAGDKFLVTAETAFGAAIGYDWLNGSLAEDERRQIAEAIVVKAIRPGLAQFAAPAPPFWTTTAMNWNLVCNGALMIAALSVLEHDADAARLFALCRNSVPVGFGEYRPDGGWAEGPGYWHYASQYAISLLDSLKTALGTDLGLGAAPGLAKTGLFRLHAAGPSGKLFNFADSEEEHSGGYWLFWLARRFCHPRDAWIERHQKKAHPFDLLWFDVEQRNPYRLRRARRFRSTDAVMLRGDWRDPETTYLGIKSGANDASEHGHYDLGGFVLDALGLRWAIDLGPDDYGLADYFKPEMRRRYYRTGTAGHNTIVIDGECQPATAHAPVSGLDLAAPNPFVVIDLAAAYPSAASALRGFALIDRRHVLVVDEIAPKGRLATVDWQMHTTAAVAISGNCATLTQTPVDGTGAVRFYLRVVEPAAAKFLLLSAAPTGPPGQNPNAGVTKLVLRFNEVAQPLCLRVLLSPDEPSAAVLRLPATLQRPLAAWPRTAASRAAADSSRLASNASTHLS